MTTTARARHAGWRTLSSSYILTLQTGTNLKLRSLSAEGVGGLSGLVIHLGEVRALAAALLDAAAEAGGSTQGLNAED